MSWGYWLLHVICHGAEGCGQLCRMLCLTMWITMSMTFVDVT